MIFLDVNQTVISNVHMLAMKQQLDENLVLHMVLNSIRLVNAKFSRDYGRLVICGDGKDSWRKEVFPHYKAHRKQVKENSNLDWNMIFSVLNRAKKEIPENFPYRYINLDNVEADDIIAVLSKEFTDENHIIVSSDSDFYQLLKYPHIEIYNPRTKKIINRKDIDVQTVLFEKVLSGDKGDGIPNFLSAGNSFVEGIRQNTLSANKLREALRHGEQGYANPRLFCETKTHVDNFNRNKDCIDFDYIPVEITERILKSFHIKPEGNMKKVWQYFVSNKMNVLTNKIEEFKNVV